MVFLVFLASLLLGCASEPCCERATSGKGSSTTSTSDLAECRDSSTRSKRTGLHRQRPVRRAQRSATAGATTARQLIPRAVRTGTLRGPPRPHHPRPECGHSCCPGHRPRAGGLPPS